MKLTFKRNLFVILTLLALTFSSLGITPAQAASTPKVLAAYLPNAQNPAYVRAASGNAWNQMDNPNAMNTVFGAGNWSELTYETVNPAVLFSTAYDFIFMDGGADKDIPMNNFLNANRTLMENWVSNGGVLYLNSAGWTTSVVYGFGGVQAVFTPASANGNAVNPAHPIFNGPFLPAGTAFTGGSFAHDHIVGGSTSPIMTGQAGVLLSETAWGSGWVIFGGLTGPFAWDPAPNDANLLANILAYLDSKQTPAVTGPTMDSFTRQDPATSPTSADSLVFRAAFSEDVQNVDAADFAVTGSTASITNVNTVDAMTYDITVSGGDLANLNGIVGLNVAAGQDITDLDGNALSTAEPATDETYALDNNLCAVNVAELNAYTMAYKLSIPVDANYAASSPVYSVNNTASIPNGSFDRVGYCLELNSNWVWVSMDTFTSSAALTGVPVGSTGFQQTLNNLNVNTNVAGVVTGSGISTGNIEFWSSCYTETNGLGLPGANGGLYDFDDIRETDNCYGSMQVHNYGAAQTVLAWNRWAGGGGSDDLGIGNDTTNPNGGHPDWTFHQNAGSYATRTLTVYVGTGDTIAPSVDSFAATSPSNSVNIPITDFSASDDTAVTGYLITESATPPAAGDAGWSGTAPATYTVIGEGTYDLYPWAKDAAGNVSAVYGPVTVDAVVDNALHFDGTNDYVRTDSNLALGGNVTYEAWIKTTATGDWRGIVTTQANSFEHFLQMATNNAGYLRAEVSNGTFTFYWVDATTTPINDGNWHHVAVTYATASETFHLYVDGVDQAFTVGNHDGAITDLNINGPILIGQERELNAPLNATIDEVRIWNVVRSQAEIQANKNNELSPQAGLVAYYRFNQGVPGGNNAGLTTALDASGNGYNGTLYNLALNGATSNWVDGYVPPSDTTAPVLNLPGNMTVEATGPSGAVVTFSATATDETSPAEPVVTCNPASGSTFGLGTTTVNCSASDDAGNTANGSFDITVEDTTAPVVTVPANITTEATGPAGAVVSFAAATASDLVDGSLTPVCDANSGDTFPIGTTTVTCSATDNAGNTGSASFDITVEDTTAPVVNVPGNMTVEATGPAGAAVSFSVSADDLVDGSLTPVCDANSGDTFPLGTTTVSCSATDNAGNTGSASFDITVEDTTAPVVNVPGNMTVEATGPAGAVVTFSVSADDLVDGSLTPVCDANSGDTFPLGTTTVTCSATDNAGNTGSASFDITVEDTTAPVVNVPGNMTVEATGPAGAAVSFSVSADDLVDGSLTPVCDANSGDTFPLGTTTVTCSATDNAGNTGSASFDITVEDTTAPDLTVPGNMTVVATSPAGADVTFSATATDLVDPAPVVSCNPASGSTFPIGTTTVSCSASDAAGNISAPQTFDVTVTTPGVSVDPLSHDFGSQAVGTTSAAQPFTLTNSGSSDLTLGTLSLSGDFALANDLCSGQTLAPLGGCTFGVTFSPTASAPLTGEVSIPSDAFSSPNLVPLSGTGFFLAPVTLTNPASGITLTGATLNGTVDANFDPATVSFEYGLTDAYGSTVAAAQSPVSGGADTPVSAAISGLLPNTTYHFRAVAQNSAGTSYGIDLTFNTGMSTPTVSTDAASAVGNRVATLNGMVNAMNDETTVIFEYGLDTAYGSTVSAGQSPVTGSSDTPVSASLSGLLQNSTYHFRAVATNSQGTTYGEDMTFTTTFGKLSKSFKSIASKDGWTLEGSESSGKGQVSFNGTTMVGDDYFIGLPEPLKSADLLAGDDDFNRQFRSILAFNTAGLPDNAVIVSVTLKLKKQGLVGTNPFSTHKGLLVDIRKPFFGGSASLAPADFQAAASRNSVGLIGKTPVNGWYKSAIKPAAFPFINLGGSTQFRIRFQVDDNNDKGADYLRFFGGDADPAYQPVLVIEYYLP